MTVIMVLLVIIIWQLAAIARSLGRIETRQRIKD